MDDVLLNKAAIIGRCLMRVKEEYVNHEASLETNYTQQDAILLNVQRACEASIDAAMHLVRIRKLGIPQQSRDAFRMLEAEEIISAALSKHLQAMVGFRNIAIHQYQALSLDVLRYILQERLVDFKVFASLMSSMAVEHQGKEDE